MSRSLLRVVTTHNNCDSSTKGHNTHAFQHGTGCLKNLRFTECEFAYWGPTCYRQRESSGLQEGSQYAILRVPVACSRRDSSMQIHNSVKLSFFRHPVASFLFFNGLYFEMGAVGILEAEVIVFM